MTTRSFYLGPAQPRVAISSWSDLVAAAGAGVFHENQWVELKKDVPAGTPANVELARDLASLSVDGGVLIIGVHDKTHEVVGTSFAGLEDRITQVAASRISPALQVVIAPPFHWPDDPAKAALVVTVPPSQTAPHMADGNYWHRNAQGKQIMGDSHVRLLLRDREQRIGDFGQRLRALSDVEFDSWPIGERVNGHLYLLAEPAADRVPSTLDEAGAAGLEPDDLWRTVLGVQMEHQPPTLRYAQSSVPHPDGLLFASWERGLDSSLGEREHLRVLLRNDGAVMVASGAGVTPRYRPPHIRTIELGGETEPPRPNLIALQDHLAPFVHTWCVLIAHLAETYLGYSGEWRLGVYLTGTHLARSDSQGPSTFRGFQAREYIDQTTATTAQLTTDPGVVTERLLTRLARGLNASMFYSPLRLPPRS